MNHQSKYLQVKETKRLYIRPIGIKDIKAWVSFIDNSEALKYFPEEFRTNPNAASDWIDGQLKRYREGTYGLMSLIEKSNGAYVGQCGLLMRLEFEPNLLEIGYSLIPDHWGKGYATEASQFFRDYAFKNQLSDRVISLINPLNLPSQKVALRNGMTNIDTVKFYKMDHFMFSIDRETWRNSAGLPKAIAE